MKKNIILQSVVIGFAALVTFGIILYKNYYKELQKVRAMPVEQRSLDQVKNGTYEGAFAYGGFTYKVAVTVSNARYASIVILTNRTTDYARRAETVIPLVMASNSIAIDAKTGATTTAKALLKAIENALSNAR